MHAKIEKSIEEELKKYGTVYKTNLLDSKTDGVDLSVFNQGMLLIYKIENESSSPKKTLKASLDVQNAFTTIESKNYLILDSSDDENNIIVSFSKLLSSFIANYKLVNTKKPVFNLVIQ